MLVFFLRAPLIRSFNIGFGNLGTGPSMDTTAATLLSKHSNAFGLEVLNALSPEADGTKETEILSPYGLIHALSMLLPASGEGSTAHAALLKVLFKGFPNEQGAKTAMHSLSAMLKDAHSEGILEFCEGNAAFVSKRIELKDAYQETLASSYDANVFPLETAAQVNGWVSKATKEKITEIIDDTTAAQVSLILINAIYFKGLWEEQFNPADTNMQPFFTMDGSQVNAPLMYLKYDKGPAVSGYEFTTSGNIPCVAVRMQYKGGAFSAVFSMPTDDVKQAQGPLTLESGMLYGKALATCQREFLTALSTGHVKWKAVGPHGYSSAKIFLPSFELTCDYSLGTLLQNLGLSSIFKPGDFTRLANVDDLFVSDVKQKVYVKVDEKGTEAAAVTSIMMMRAMIQPMNELFVKFDRPFHMSIVHNDTGLALFTGIVENPVEQK